MSLWFVIVWGKGESFASSRLDNLFNRLLCFSSPDASFFSIEADKKELQAAIYFHYVLFHCDYPLAGTLRCYRERGFAAVAKEDDEGHLLTIPDYNAFSCVNPLLLLLARLYFVYVSSASHKCKATSSGFVRRQNWEQWKKKLKRGEWSLIRRDVWLITQWDFGSSQYRINWEAERFMMWISIKLRLTFPFSTQQF